MGDNPFASGTCAAQRSHNSKGADVVGGMLLCAFRAALGTAMFGCQLAHSIASVTAGSSMLDAFVAF